MAQAPGRVRAQSVAAANGYGYHFWTMRGQNRRFYLRGVYGQQMYVDPELKLVLVHTAVAKTASINNDSMGAERVVVWVGEYVRTLVGVQPRRAAAS